MPESVRDLSPTPYVYALSPDSFIKIGTPQKIYSLSQKFSDVGECKNFLEQKQNPELFFQDSESVT